MDFGAASFRHSHDQDLNLSKRRECSSPQLIREMWDAGQNQALQLRSVFEQKLVQTILADALTTIQIQGYQTASVALLGESPQNLWDQEITTYTVCSQVQSVEGRYYAVVEGVLLTGREPAQSGQSGQQVRQAFSRQIRARNIQILQLGLFPLDGLHVLAL